MVNIDGKEIKVGQIWYDRIFGTTFTVVFVPDERDIRIYQDKVNVIHRNGCVGFLKINDIRWKICQLVAEYKTWNDAVNSKEFKNER